MGQNFKRFLFGSYAVVFLLFLGLQYFMKTAHAEGSRYTALLSYDHEVIIVMQDVLISLQRAESSRRGYIITNNRDFIQDYNSAVKSVQQSLFYLKQLNVNGSYRDEFLDSLQASINDRVEIIKSSIDLAMGNNSSDSAQAAFTNQGKELMGSIRGTIFTLMKERQNSRDDSSRALEQVDAEIATLYTISFVVTIIFGCVLTAATYFSFKKLGIIQKELRYDLFLARQQVQHATSRYQDLKVELMEKTKSGESGPAKDS